MKVNLGCGSAYVPGWTNVDSSPDVEADIHLDAKEFIDLHGHKTTALYMGHFIEHLMPADALELLRSMVAALPPGAEVSAVIPDIRQIFHAYESGEVGNRELNEWYINSCIQPSHHLWCHDEASLGELFRGAGFEDVVPIEPCTWPPVWHKDGLGARFQSGIRGTVPARAVAEEQADGGAGQPEVAADGGTPADHRSADGRDDAAAMNESPEERLNRLVRMVGVEAHLRYSAEALQASAERDLAELHAQIDAIRRSRSFRLARLGRDVAQALVPQGSGRARAARSVVRRVGALTRHKSPRG